MIAGPVMCFVYLDQGLVFAQKMAAATITGIIALSSFCFAYSWLCLRFSWLPTLLLAVAVFFAMAWLLVTLNLGFSEAVLLALVVVLLQLYLSPVLHDRPFLVPAAVPEIACRMALACVLVFGVTQFAETLGETYSGILAVFPVAGSTLALFSHRNHSARHAIRSLKSMKQGLLSMLLFFYLIVVMSEFVGFPAAVLIATLAALLLQGVVKLVRQNFPKLSGAF